MGKAIKKEEWYSLQDVVKGGYLIGATTFWSARKIIKSDLKSGNLLKAVITGKGRGLKYRFKGEHIITFINAVEAGKVRLK